MRKKIVTCIVIIAFGYYSYLCFKKSHYDLITQHELQQVRQKLNMVPLDEKKDLAYFFEYANVFDQYAYTLVGYKPMSVCSYLQDAEDLPPIFRDDYQKNTHREFADRLERGVQAWEKNKHLFDNEEFLVIISHSSISKGMRRVYLVHKELCQGVISSSFDVFVSQLANLLSFEELFAGLSNPDDSRFSEIQENDFLLGILLGFGENNARLFCETRRDGLTGFSKEWIVWPRKWLLPGFLCDPTTDETRELKLKYEKARKHVRWTYFNRNNLEVTLALLTKNSKIDGPLR